MIKKVGILIVLYCSISNLFGQFSNADSLINVANSLPDNQEKLEILVEIANTLNWDDWKRASPFIQEALDLAKTLKNDKYLGLALQAYHDNETTRGLPKDSLNFLLDAALSAYKKADDFRGQADILIVIAQNKETEGQLDEAMGYAFKAQKIYEDINDRFKIHNNYLVIAGILASMKNGIDALKYIERAENYFMTEEKDPYEVCYFYLVRSGVYNVLNRTEDYVKDTEQLFKMAQEHSFLNDVTTTGVRLGDHYLGLEQMEKAKFYYDAALESSTNLDHPYFKSYARSGRGAYFSKIGDHTQALKEFEQAAIILKNPMNKFFRNGINIDLANTHAQLSNHEEAYKFMKRYAEIQDTVYQNEAKRIAAETEASYQNEKKELQLQQKEKEQQQFYIVLGLLLLAGLATLWALLQKNKANKLLAEKNEEKEFLLKEIHHRVKNNLQIISSLLNLQTSSIENTSAKHAVIEGRNRVQSMSLIHQKLYMGDNIASIDMKAYLADLSNHLLHSFGREDGRVVIQSIIDLPPLDVDTAIPLGLIINELLTNSLKYAFEDKDAGQINIQLFIDNQKDLHLIVEDDGKGFSAHAIASTKFGTKIVQILCKKLKGKIQNSTVAQGYKTHIVFSRYQLGRQVNSLT